jgi:hypothetical protein
MMVKGLPVGLISGGMVSTRFVEQFAGLGLWKSGPADFLEVAFGLVQGLPGLV